MLALSVPDAQAEGTQLLFYSVVQAKTGQFPLSPTASALSLPDGLVEDDGGGNRNIETSHVAQHGDADHLVTPFPHEPSQSVPFGAYNNRRWKGEIPLIEIGRAHV